MSMQVVTVEPGGHTRDHSRKIRLLLVRLADLAAQPDSPMHALYKEGVVLRCRGRPVQAMVDGSACVLTVGDFAELWGAWTGAHHCGGCLEITADTSRPFSRARDGREVERSRDARFACYPAQHRLQGMPGKALGQE